MLEVVNAAAQGDLTQEITVRGSDAIGQLGEGLATFFGDLRESISAIAGNAQSLAPGMKGTAKISTGSAPIALHWARRAAHALYYFGWSRL